MNNASVKAFRERAKATGFRRVEFYVHVDHIDLMKRLARALWPHAATIREFLDRLAPEPGGIRYDDWLAAGEGT